MTPPRRPDTQMPLASMQERIASLQHACDRLRGEIADGPAPSYADLSGELEDVLGQLDDARHEIDRLQSVERAQRDEIGYWRQRAQEIEETLGKVRGEADRILAEARGETEQLSRTAIEAARSIEQEAQARAEQILARARSDANEMLSRALATSESAHRRLLEAQQRIAQLDAAHEKLRASLRNSVEEAETTLRRIDMGAVSIDYESSPPPPLVVAPEISSIEVAQAASDDIVDASTPPGIPNEGRLESVDTTTPSQPAVEIVPEVVPVTAPPSATTVVIEAYPFRDFSALARFESAIARLDAVTDVHIASYAEQIAELQIDLREARTAKEIVASLPDFPFEIESEADGRLSVRLFEPESRLAA